ncbi:Uncharacterised protein [Klebsiella pneumoniae]|nr:Uncharacterised protein [Klebsiella pneumoniae]
MTRRQSTIAAQGYARQPCSRITLGQCRSHCQQVGKRAEIPRNQAEPLIEASHLAIDAKAARLGLQHPTQHLQQTRFAAAIATAEQTALTPLQHQINPLAMPAHVRRSRNHCMMNGCTAFSSAAASGRASTCALWPRSWRSSTLPRDLPACSALKSSRILAWEPRSRRP